MLPENREMVGPVQIQQLLQDLAQLKEEVRSLRIGNSPTVQAEVTSYGTTLTVQAAPPASAEGTPLVWI